MLPKNSITVGEDGTKSHKVNWCINPTNKDGAFDVEHNRFWETIHPSCPLKQQPITIKLEENEKEGH